MNCPRCNTAMSTVVRDTIYDRIEIDVCTRCQGVWFDRRELEAALQLPNLEALGPESPLLEGSAPSRPCPRNPRVLMHERHLAVQDADLPRLKLDQCADCGGVFLDGGELPTTIAALKDRRVRPFLEHPENVRSGSLALWLFMFFTGLPVEQWNPRVRRPIVMPLLLAACVAVFWWQLSGGMVSLERSVMEYGMIPERLMREGTWPTLLTSMFLHGSIAHLLGNMYFLWVFGDNVEDRLGKLRFLALYLVSGVVAGLCHAYLQGDKASPVVGASGAISGVMAAYAILFPRTHLVSLILFFRVRWRASIYLFGWLGMQLLGAALNQRGIAWWAHIGGFVVGALVAWRWRPPPLVAPSSLGPRASA